MVQFPRGIKAISARLIRSAPSPTSETVFTKPVDEEKQETLEQRHLRRSLRGPPLLKLRGRNVGFESIIFVTN